MTTSLPSQPPSTPPRTVGSAGSSEQPNSTPGTPEALSQSMMEWIAERAASGSPFVPGTGPDSHAARAPNGSALRRNLISELNATTSSSLSASVSQAAATVLAPQSDALLPSVNLSVGFLEEGLSAPTASFLLPSESAPPQSADPGDVLKTGAQITRAWVSERVGSTAPVMTAPQEATRSSTPPTTRSPASPAISSPNLLAASEPGKQRAAVRTFVRIEPQEQKPARVASNFIEFINIALGRADLEFTTEVWLVVMSWFLTLGALAIVDLILFATSKGREAKAINTLNEAREAWSNSGLTKTEFQAAMVELGGLAHEVVVAAKKAAGRKLHNDNLKELDQKIEALKARMPETEDPMQLIEMEEAISKAIQTGCQGLTIELVYNSHLASIEYPMHLYILKGLNRELLRENRSSIKGSDDAPERTQQVNAFLDQYSSEFKGIFSQAEMQERVEHIKKGLVKKYVLFLSGGATPDQAHLELQQDLKRVFPNWMTAKEIAQYGGVDKLLSYIERKAQLAPVKTLLSMLRMWLDSKQGKSLENINLFAKRLDSYLGESFEIVSPDVRKAVGRQLMRSLFQGKGFDQLVTLARNAFVEKGAEGLKQIEEAARSALLIDQDQSLLPGLNPLLQERAALEARLRKMEISIDAIESEAQRLISQGMKLAAEFLSSSKPEIQFNVAERNACREKIEMFGRDFGQLKTEMERNVRKIRREVLRVEISDEVSFKKIQSLSLSSLDVIGERFKRLGAVQQEVQVAAESIGAKVSPPRPFVSPESVSSQNDDVPALVDLAQPLPKEQRSTLAEEGPLMPFVAAQEPTTMPAVSLSNEPVPAPSASANAINPSQPKVLRPSKQQQEQDSARQALTIDKQQGTTAERRDVSTDTNMDHKHSK